MKKIYVQEPRLLLEIDADPASLLMIYGVSEWEQDALAIQHAPGSNDATQVPLLWGEGIAEIRSKAIDAILAFFPGTSSNDIIFLGGWN